MKKILCIGILAVLLTGCAKEAQVKPDTPIETVRPITVEIEPVDFACLIDPDDVAPVFELSDYERWVVECVVMGEAEGESWDGKVLVAQCLLNACLKDDLQPSEVRTKYKYSGWNEEPSTDVMTAVTAVFDDGHKVTSEPILYFYAPKYSQGKFHETQCHVITEGGHKFFKEWS